MSIFTVIRGIARARKLGALRRHGPRDPRDKLYTPGHRTGVRLAAAGPDSIVTVVPHVPAMFDQGGSGSCVMQTLVNAMGTVEAAQGLKPVLGSRRAGYYLGRRKDDLHHQDGGMYSETAFWLARKYGLPSESVWGWSELTLNQPVPGHIVLEGHQRADLNYEFLRGNAVERHALVRAAHEEGLPVYADAPVGRAFMRHRGGVFDSVESPEGGHAFLLVSSGYDGRTPIHELWNSWGLDWANGGRTWVGPKFFETIGNLVVVHGWKRSARQRALLAGGIA